MRSGLLSRLSTRAGTIVSEIDGTTGDGSVLAPNADDPSLNQSREATFGFVLFMNGTGELMAPSGNPNRIRLTATDEPDTFRVRVEYLDEDRVEQVFYETEADQALLSGDVRVNTPQTSEPTSTCRTKQS